MVKVLKKRPLQEKLIFRNIAVITRFTFLAVDDTYCTGIPFALWRHDVTGRLYSSTSSYNALDNVFSDLYELGGS